MLQLRIMDAVRLQAPPPVEAGDAAPQVPPHLNEKDQLERASPPKAAMTWEERFEVCRISFNAPARGYVPSQR